MTAFDVGDIQVGIFAGDESFSRDYDDIDAVDCYGDFDFLAAPYSVEDSDFESGPAPVKRGTGHRMPRIAGPPVVLSG